MGDRAVPVSPEITLCTRSEGSGPPVLLVMGIRLQLIHWPPRLCAALQERGLRVIRFDNRDSGCSTVLSHLGRPARSQMLPIPGRAPPYRLSDMAEDVLGLMDALDLPDVHLVGVSMGGMIAQLVALRAPARLRSLTLLMTTPGGFYRPRARAVRALLRPSPRGGGPEAQTEAFLAVQEALRGRGAPPFSTEHVQAMRAVCHAAWARAPRDDTDSFLRQLAAIMDAPARHRALRALDVPTRIIHGELDPLLPAHAGFDLARCIPGAELHIVQGMGHGLPRWAQLPVASLIADHVMRHEAAWTRTHNADR